MEPDEKLWKLNYIAYSVTVAWRHVNDDYQRTLWGRKQRPRNVKCEKENFAVRQHLSKASGEDEAIQKQPKMTKRRVKRRKQISAKCKAPFAKDLTEFIEKTQTVIPKLIKYSWCCRQTKTPHSGQVNELRNRMKNELKSDVFGNDFKLVWCVKCFLIAYSLRKTNSWRWKP